jgi:hypothetical protein
MLFASYQLKRISSREVALELKPFSHSIDCRLITKVISVHGVY